MLCHEEEVSLCDTLYSAQTDDILNRAHLDTNCCVQAYKFEACATEARQCTRARRSAAAVLVALQSLV
jgi:hypothetical protein